MAGQSNNTRQETKENYGRNCLQLDDLQKLLDCPVCWRRSDPEDLIQCRNGHLGCRACFSRLSTCPLCRVILQPEIQTFSDEIVSTIRSELRHVEGQSPLIWPEAIARIFKCSNCQFTATQGPVFQCQKGHVQCYKCTDSATMCRPCFQKTGKFPALSFDIRSLAAQELLCSVPKPCRFAKHGCSAIIKSLSQHETNCKFSENRCIMFYCYDRVSLPKLLTHLLKDCRENKDVLYNADPHTFSSTSYGGFTIPWIPDTRVTILKLGVDKYFSFSCVPLMSTILFFTHFLGTPEEAKNFHYILKLKFKKDGPSIERKAPVIPANYCKFKLCNHPDLIKISFTEIREALEITTSAINFVFRVEVKENNT